MENGTSCLTSFCSPLARVRIGVRIKCHHCHSENCIKNGKTSNAKQRYKCKSCAKRFIDHYTYQAYQPNLNHRIIMLTKEGLGIRSTARVLGISVTTLLKRIISIAQIVKPPIISLGKEYKVDEICTYIGNKENRIWIVCALDKNSKSILDFRGKATQTVTTHKRTTSGIKVKTTDYFAYDKMERLTKHTQSIDNSTTKNLIAQNQYDRLGQLVTKNVGGPQLNAVDRWQELNYKYNGKEFQDELGLGLYDYHARLYDPAIGRMLQIDPKASKYSPMTPYNYVANSPLNFVDPDGKDFRLIINKQEDGTYQITVQSTVHVYGKDASKDRVAELNYNFKQASKETYQGEGVQLNYDVQFVYHENVDDAKEAVLNSPGDNIMQLDRGLSDNEMYSNVVFPEDRNSLAGGEKSSERTTTAPGIAFKKEANVRRYLDINGILEFGHLLGFPDFY